MILTTSKKILVLVGTPSFPVLGKIQTVAGKFLKKMETTANLRAHMHRVFKDDVWTFWLDCCSVMLFCSVIFLNDKNISI